MIPILGMHRSGTSALAGALHKLGANLGAESDWIAPAADNPLGFFEFSRVVGVNRAILADLGGTWSSPPALPAGWMSDARIAEQRASAERLLAELPQNLVVKDPRLSLLLPLWEDVGSVGPAVICLRHPVAVARSLEQRNSFPVDVGLFLWFRYTAATLINRPDALVIEYEALLTTPDDELARVAEHIALATTATTIKGAAGSIRESMAHHESRELPDSPIGALCDALYTAARSPAGLESNANVAAWAHVVSELPWAGPAARELTIAAEASRSLKLEIDELTNERDRLRGRVERLESDVRRLASTLDRITFDETASMLASLEDTPS